MQRVFTPTLLITHSRYFVHFLPTFTDLRKLFKLVLSRPIFLSILQCCFLVNEISFKLSSYKKQLSVVSHYLGTSLLACIALCEGSFSGGGLR